MIVDLFLCVVPAICSFMVVELLMLLLLFVLHYVSFTCVNPRTSSCYFGNANGDPNRKIK